MRSRTHLFLPKFIIPMASVQTYRGAQMEPSGSISGSRDMQAAPIDDHEEKEALGLEDSGSEDNAEAGSLVNMFQSRMQFHDALVVASGNRTISDDHAEVLLNGFAADADEEVVITFREGKRDKFDDSALSVDIALFYVPGPDLAEVNISENRGISKEEASQKNGNVESVDSWEYAPGVGGPERSHNKEGKNFTHCSVSHLKV